MTNMVYDFAVKNPIQVAILVVLGGILVVGVSILQILRCL